MKTLEQFIRDNDLPIEEGTVGYLNGERGNTLGSATFRLVITEGDNGQPVKGYIHPEGRSGDTINVLIAGNQLVITDICS
jgi:hypothetical protein